MIIALHILLTPSFGFASQPNTLIFNTPAILGKTTKFENTDDICPNKSDFRVIHAANMGNQ